MEQKETTARLLRAASKGGIQTVEGTKDGISRPKFPRSFLPSIFLSDLFFFRLRNFRPYIL